MAKIGAVIVTYNRLDKLKVALRCFEKQTYKCSFVLVVDNASNDGTEDYLEKWKKVETGYRRIVIKMESNTGGSGGFYSGLEKSQTLDADWIWVSDDDAYPAFDAIEKANSYLEAHKKEWNNISALCSQVINNGCIDYMHRKNILARGRKIIRQPSVAEDYLKESFTINAFSYVGTVINKVKLLKVGLPIKDYFIWYDDTEHSLRLSKVGEILCIPAIIVYHDVPETDNGELSWKRYYGLRNEWDMWRRHFPAYLFWLDVYQTKYKIFWRKIFGRKKIETAIIEAALKDVLERKFGLHHIYKPGWKSEL